jgi:hypothetical protein
MRKPPFFALRENKVFVHLDLESRIFVHALKNSFDAVLRLDGVRETRSPFLIGSENLPVLDGHRHDLQLMVQYLKKSNHLKGCVINPNYANGLTSRFIADERLSSWFGSPSKNRHLVVLMMTPCQTITAGAA